MHPPHPSEYDHNQSFDVNNPPVNYNYMMPQVSNFSMFCNQYINSQQSTNTNTSIPPQHMPNVAINSSMGGHT